MVFDQTYRNRYLFAGVPGRQPFRAAGTRRASWCARTPSPSSRRRWAFPPRRSAPRSSASNGFARSGVDEDFGRGESAYDKYYTDPTVKPNCSLAPIEKGPFYAVKIVPGDLGTKGGLVTDERARVLREDGSVIPGLYAAGNASSAVMGRTYPVRAARSARDRVRLPRRRGPRGARRVPTA